MPTLNTSTHHGPNKTTSHNRSPRRAAAMRCLAAIVVFYLTCCLQVPAMAAVMQPEDSTGPATQLAAAIKAPGVVVVEFTSKGVAAEDTFGVAGDGQKIQSDSTFVWGSVSKSITALAVWSSLQQDVAKQGDLSLDSPIGDVLPQVKGTGLATSGVTLRDLINHTSGLPHDVSVTDDWSRRANALETLPLVAERQGSNLRGTYRYSSLNYLVLQAVVEHLSGKPFGEAVNTLIGERTGVSDLVADPQTFAERVTPGHLPFFFGAKKVRVGVDTSGWGYGYLAGSGQQLATYGSWQLKDYRSDDPAAQKRYAPCLGSGNSPCHAAGLNHTKVPDSDGQNVHLVRHSGAVPGYYTHLAFSPEKDKGVVILANTYGELKASSLTAEVDRLVHDRVLGVEQPASNHSVYAYVIAGGLLLAAVVAGLTLWVVVVSVRRCLPDRSRRSTFVRLAAYVAGGVGIMAFAWVGVPTLAGVSLEVMYRWAPDLAILIWAVLGLLFVLVLWLITREIRGGHWRASNGTSG